MTTHPSNDDDDDDEQLRFAACRGCGYSLTGLPTEGVCPECGESYEQDPQKIILQGTARGTHANFANARFRHAWVPMITLAGSLFPLALFIFMPSPNMPYMPLMYAPLFLVLLFVPLWFRFNRRGRGLIEVYLTPRGCRQDDVPHLKYSTLAITTWRSVAGVTLKRGQGSTHRLTITGGRWLMQTPVDADVELTDEQAAALLRRIDQWRRVADGAWRRP